MTLGPLKVGAVVGGLSMGLAVPADPPAIEAPAPLAQAQARPIVLAQLEPPLGSLQVRQPPTSEPGEKTEKQAAKPAGVHPAWLKPEIDLDLTRTTDLNLLYFAPAETYLTPYVGRSLENAIASQKRIFGWTPWERTTVLLKDFADYGNAGARVTPNNTLLLEISPLSQIYETLSAGERFFTLANHETTHLVTMDAWNSADARWRRFFRGKPFPIAEHPETIFYNYVAAPRVTSPRWYLEGSAVFMETWMAGGYGRAQGAYDEMVFRAMVRDNTHFYSPLGLQAEGDQVDFQVGVNDYLYGTRFMSYMAETRSPEKLIKWWRRDEGSKAYYAAQFRQVFGEPLDKVWNEWIAWEHDFQRANLASVQAYPATPTHRLTPLALGSISRSFYDPATDSLVGGFRYPGVIAHMGELSLASGKIRHLADIQGPVLYRVTSLAYDPKTRTAWYTAGQLQRPPQPDPARRGQRPHQDPAHPRADRGRRLQPRRPLALGVAPRRGTGDPRAHPGALYELESGPHLQVRRGAVRPRHFAGREPAVGLGGRGGRRPVGARLAPRGARP